MKNSSISLRPQDILVLLKLVTWRARGWKQLDLAIELNLSQAEIANSLSRLSKSALVDDSKRKIRQLAVLEFLVHAIKYFYPAELGSPSRGVPTAHSTVPLSKLLVVEGSDALVWPSADGKVRGISLNPIYSSAPFAAGKDPKLHELLSLVDAIRVGRAREKKIAEVELKKRIMRQEL